MIEYVSYKKDHVWVVGGIASVRAEVGGRVIGYWGWAGWWQYTVVMGYPMGPMILQAFKEVCESSRGWYADVFTITRKGHFAYLSFPYNETDIYILKCLCRSAVWDKGRWVVDVNIDATALDWLMGDSERDEDEELAAIRL